MRIGMYVCVAGGVRGGGGGAGAGEVCVGSLLRYTKGRHPRSYLSHLNKSGPLQSAGS